MIKYALIKHLTIEKKKTNKIEKGGGDDVSGNFSELLHLG